MVKSVVIAMALISHDSCFCLDSSYKLLLLSSSQAVQLITAFFLYSYVKLVFLVIKRKHFATVNAYWVQYKHRHIIPKSWSSLFRIFTQSKYWILLAEVAYIFLLSVFWVNKRVPLFLSFIALEVLCAILLRPKVNNQ